MARYRLALRYEGEMAAVEDTHSVEWGRRHGNTLVSRLMPYGEAKSYCDALEARHEGRCACPSFAGQDFKCPEHGHAGAS